MNIITVAKGFFSRYSTIGKALKAAQAGDKIIVKPGTYEEAIFIDKSVEICGDGQKEEVIIQSLDSNTLFVTAGNAVLRRLTIRQTGSQEKRNAIRIEGGSSCFEDCLIYSTSGDGVSICYADTNPTFKNCIISNNHGFGVDVRESAQGSFENCHIGKNTSSNIRIMENANPRFQDCHIFGSKMNGVWACENGLGKMYHCKIYENEYPNIAIASGGNTHFENCEIYSGQGHGIWSSEGGLGVFVECNIYDNHEKNIFIKLKGNPRFEKCKIFNALKNPGIWCSEDGLGSFIECEITANGGVNVSVLSGANPLFEKCHIHHGEKNGVWVREGGLGKFIACEIYANQSANVAVNLEGNPSFEQCMIYDGFKQGIWVQETGAGEFKHCKVFNNVKEQNIVIESSETIVQYCTETGPVKIGDVQKQLDNLIGLEGVKKQIAKTIQFIEFNKEVSQYGINGQDIKLAASHTVLSGNPGTGKTTVARLLGSLYAAMGLLPSGHVVAVNREKLVGQYIGHTAPKTKEWIEKAIGGILFIDEAYELSNKGKNDFGPEAIAILLEEMENRRGEFIVAIAGYEEEIKQFLEINPGLKSRFNQEFKLEDYTPEEMKQIALKLFKEKERIISEDGLQVLFQEFTNLWRKRDRFFANARVVRNLVEASFQQQAERCMAAPREQWNKDFLVTVTKEDIQAILPKEVRNQFILPIQEKVLQEALAHLDSLVGLQNVKKEIHKLVTLVRYYREEEKDISVLSPHTILKGSPGTGKTEVARIIGKIYEALGILERGDLVEVNRDKLVRSYAGESEKITAQFIEKAMGGTLFIDEAYQLTQYGQDDPGHKVVEVLLKYMEDRRGEFIVIAAGYSAQMDRFLNSNDGLRRRFARQLEFEDYTPDELMKISDAIIAKSGYYLEESARQQLHQYFGKVYGKRDRSFGNAGFARNLITETIKNVDFRVAQIAKENRTPEMISTIFCEDLVLNLAD